MYEQYSYGRRKLLDITLTQPVHIGRTDPIADGLTGRELAVANVALGARNREFSRSRQHLLDTLRAPRC
jgi:hypothetical protein